MAATAQRRGERTRADVMAAFTRMVFATGFESVSVRALVADAGIARSTFYEHFSSKEDVLRACMGRFFGIIADCVCLDAPPAELPRVLAHLWENRRLTDAIFSGQARAILARNQTDLVEARLRAMAGADSLALPTRLAAAALGEAQLTMVETWMRGRVHCPLERIADGLHRTSRASALALAEAGFEPAAEPR